MTARENGKLPAPYQVEMSEVLELIREELGRLACISTEVEDAIVRLAGADVLGEDKRLQRLDSLTQNLRGLQAALCALKGVNGATSLVDPYALTSGVVPKDLADRLQPERKRDIEQPFGDISLF